MTTGIPQHFRPAAGKAVQARYPKSPDLHSRDPLADHEGRALPDVTRTFLLQLTEDSGLRPRIDAAFRHERNGVTEKRAVSHVAVLAPRRQSMDGDRESVVPLTTLFLAGRPTVHLGTRSEMAGPHRQARS